MVIDFTLVEPTESAQHCGQHIFVPGLFRWYIWSLFFMSFLWGGGVLHTTCLVMELGGGGGYVLYNLPCNGMGGGGMSLSFHTTYLLAIIFCISIYTRHNSCCINILDILGYTNKGSGQSVRKNAYLMVGTVRSAGHLLNACMACW